MTKDQVTQLLTLIQTEYPQSFRAMDERMLALKLELWTKEFQNDDGTLVYAAVRTYMRSGERFAPTIGQVREKIRLLTGPDTLSEQGAWALVSEACRNGSYGYLKEFNKLPPDIQRAVGRPEQLKEWAALDTHELQTVVASNFMRTYRTQAARAEALEAIPDEARALLGSMAQNLAMPAAPKREPLPAPVLEKLQLIPPAQRPAGKPAPEPEYAPPDATNWEQLRQAALQALERNK